ncbi:pyridoxamine 5'-phosphate oxidase family protein [Defluviimonas aestuarii]|uniref:pyridoxamine 5'-phosphate oxidase family protein n=1 Tax=Albidovulum aestuarii TaxID=1130726 RepID=UPI00249B2A7F|nr:pyridoxamine 5'-phosphate oxidase family protein [Defluviimonas aestuarii]MDI3337961.1 pyridoxamine 5'-phosphate oxidase family protein [Defluviimonas aestuarii]
MPLAFADIAFTPSVRAAQERHGSAATYAKFLAPDRDGGHELTAAEATFLTARDGFFQATVSETGWPYVQFRGGRPGFLKVIDARTIAYADYRGNRQYLSVGNLTSNDRVSIIAVDYPNQRRLKLWGHATLTEDAEIISALTEESDAVVERGVVIRIAAFDWNCPRHIPQRRTDAEHDAEVARLHNRIAELEHQNFPSD